MIRPAALLLFVCSANIICRFYAPDGAAKIAVWGSIFPWLPLALAWARMTGLIADSGLAPGAMPLSAIQAGHTSMKIDLLASGHFTAAQDAVVNCVYFQGISPRF